MNGPNDLKFCMQGSFVCLFYFQLRMQLYNFKCLSVRQSVHYQKPQSFRIKPI